MPTDLFSLSARVEVPLLIVFADCTRYTLQSYRLSSAQLAETMNTFYEKVSTRVRSGAGRLVKFIGDAALFVFAEENVDQGAETLLALKQEIDDWFISLGWESRLRIKAHFGPVIAGLYGPSWDQRFDVIGKEVNIAAMLETPGVALSAEAFRRLSPELRQRFKKHTPPVTYIRQEDPH